MIPKKQQTNIIPSINEIKVKESKYRILLLTLDLCRHIRFL